MMQIMTTNGGTHPADKWGEVTANEILAMIKVDDNSVSEAAAVARAAKRDLFPKLVDALASIHAETKEHEIGELQNKGEERLSDPHDVENAMQAGTAAVVALMKGTPFEAHFNTDDAKEHVGKIIGQHSTDIRHIERSHFVTSQQGA